MKYEIAADNTVKVWTGEEPYPADPTVLQPWWPDGTPWGSAEEATLWAQTYITSVTNPSADRPGSRPSHPTVSAAESAAEGAEAQVPLTAEKLEAYIQAEVEKRLANPE
jgi:hypothetical protein